MKHIHMKKPDIKGFFQKIRNLKMQDIKEHFKERKERRRQILEKRRNGKFARKMQPVYRMMNRLSLVLHYLLACVLNFIIEIISRHSLFEAWDYLVGTPKVFFFNAFLIFATFSIVYLVRRRVFARILLSVFWLALGVCNGYMLLKRVTPFNAQDLKAWSEGLAVSKNYFSAMEFVLLGVGIVAVILWVISMWRRGGQYTGKMHRVWALFGVVISIGAYIGLTNIAIDKRVVSNYFGNIAFAYEDYGFPYCFAASVFNTGISEPSGYSKETMDEITDGGEFSKSSTGLEEGEMPNIMFVQLESFFDPTEVEWLQFSENPIPNLRKMFQNYSSGYFKAPSVGAGTANTEFETITGMSLHYFGPGEYPYKSILKETTCESAPYVLKNLGYTTHAVHNNEANFYGRRSIFPNLGFDTFTSEEYMARENEKNPNGWVKDEVLTDEILKCLDSTEGPDYVYTISVQGHGAYPDEQILEDPEITVSGAPTEEGNNKWEYYVNEIHEMDNFVKELTDKLADYPEDVVLVMYGDHLPTMGLTVEDLDNKYLFQTEYVMWDNFGLQKKEENLAAYQMAAEVMDRVGIHEGTIFRYHQARRNTKNYQVDLETLQYDLLYGERYSYGGESPYLRTRMRMGIYDGTLDSIQCISETDHTYYIKGTEFTPSSEVKLNGEWYDTVYVNPTTLMITGTELNDFDRLAVIQRSNSSTRKPLSKSYDRSCYALYSENKWKLNNNTDTE